MRGRKDLDRQKPPGKRLGIYSNLFLLLETVCSLQLNRRKQWNWCSHNFLSSVLETKHSSLNILHRVFLSSVCHSWLHFVFSKYSWCTAGLQNAKVTYFRHSAYSCCYKGVYSLQERRQKSSQQISILLQQIQHLGEFWRMVFVSINGI